MSAEASGGANDIDSVVTSIQSPPIDLPPIRRLRLTFGY